MLALKARNLETFLREKGIPDENLKQAEEWLQPHFFGDKASFIIAYHPEFSEAIRALGALDNDWVLATDCKRIDEQYMENFIKMFSMTNLQMDDDYVAESETEYWALWNCLYISQSTGDRFIDSFSNRWELG